MKKSNLNSNFQKAKFSPNLKSNLNINTPSKSNKKVNYSGSKEKDNDFRNNNNNNIIRTTDNFLDIYDFKTSGNLKPVFTRRPTSIGKSNSKSKSNLNTNLNTNINPNLNTPSSNKKIFNTHSNASNVTTSKPFYNSPTSKSTIDTSEFLFNISDDHKTLINKNTRLMSLLVQASNKITEMSTKINEKEEESRLEKAGILSELDRITFNYRTYAEGYKNYNNQEEQFKNLKKDYEHNYNVLTSYGKSLSLFLKDYMTMYKLMLSYMNTNCESNNNLKFIFDIKDLILENLNKYKGTVDVMNFQDIFEEYNQILNAPKRMDLNNNYKEIKHFSNNHSPTNNKRNNSTIENNSNKRDTYNYPLKQNSISSTNIKINKPTNSIKHNRGVSVDSAVEKKNKSIEYMESHLKHFFDQTNTKNDLKELAESINSNFDKINNNLMISKETSLNTSNISNVFEKNSKNSNNRDVVESKFKTEFSFENENDKSRDKDKYKDKDKEKDKDKDKEKENNRIQIY